MQKLGLTTLEDIAHMVYSGDLSANLDEKNVLKMVKAVEGDWTVPQIAEDEDGYHKWQVKAEALHKEAADLDWQERGTSRRRRGWKRRSGKRGERR